MPNQKQNVEVYIVKREHINRKLRAQKNTLLQCKVIRNSQKIKHDFPKKNTEYRTIKSRNGRLYKRKRLNTGNKQ